MSSPRVSERFNAADSDIILQSSDEIMFKVHRKNLEVHSEGFAGANSISPASSSNDERVFLTEASAVLDLLLQHMYRQFDPDLKEVDFATLLSIAEAAEKYQVRSAIRICNIYLRLAIPDHALEMLSYAVKHGYPDMMDKAAPLTLDLPVEDLLAALDTQHMSRWMAFHRKWLDVLDIAHSSYSRRDMHGTVKCYAEVPWGENVAKTSSSIGANPARLLQLDCIFALATERCKGCNYLCKMAMEDWRNRVQEYVDAIAKFSSFKF